MDRTTIMLPTGLKLKAKQIADRLGVSLGELIREGLSTICSKENNQLRDSFFSDSHIYKGHVPKDLAENHDDYLY